MELFSAMPLKLRAVASSYSLAHGAIRTFVDPVIGTMCILASLVCVLFLIIGGYHYMTSAGKPDSLEHAKRIIRNALIGLLLVLGAATLSAILSHAYGAPNSSPAKQLPLLSSIQPQPAGSGLVDVLIKAVTGLLQNIITSIANPFMKALGYFTSATPLMAANASVLKLWLAMVGITDGLFVLVIALLGFHIMSYATFALEEIEFKHLLPQIGLIFLLFNTSIFAIDGIISISNAMISALNVTFPSISVWSTLSAVAKESGSLGLAALLIMLVFLVLVVILLVYYVGRLVTLYIGAVLSPLVLLLWLVPGFKDFVQTAAKVYIATIFVLFIHVVILQLAASIFSGLLATSPSHAPDPLMSLIVGLATVIALLKTQGVLMQLSYVSVGPRTARKLGSQFVSAISSIGGSTRRPPNADINDPSAPSSIHNSNSRLHGSIHRPLSASSSYGKSRPAIGNSAIASSHASSTGVDDLSLKNLSTTHRPQTELTAIKDLLPTTSKANRGKSS